MPIPKKNFKRNYLINNELFDNIKKLRPDFKYCNNQLKLLDFSYFLNFIRNVNDNKIKKIKKFKIVNFYLFDLNMKLLDSTLTISFLIILIESYLMKKLKLLAMDWNSGCFQRKLITPSGFCPLKNCFWNLNLVKFLHP